jgi:hypothetical protein
MTAVERPAPRTSRNRIAALILVALVGVAIGAYLDWLWWHPMSGITITLAAGGLLMLAALAWSSRWMPVRPAALGVAALGIGLLLGQNFGPSRPPITQISGRLVVQLTEPANAHPAEGPASCQHTPDGRNFEISGDPNIRVEIGDQPREEQDALQIAIARGDMWEYGEPRGDGWSLIVVVSDTGPFTDDEVPGYWYLESAPTSDLVGEGTQEAGSIRFDGLVLNASQSQGTDQPLEVSGTIEWSCDGPSAGPEG